MFEFWFTSCHIEWFSLSLWNEKYIEMWIRGLQIRENGTAGIAEYGKRASVNELDYRVEQSYPRNDEYLIMFTDGKIVQGPS